MKRRTPIRHTVKAHTREGKPVRKYERGSGITHRRAHKIKVGRRAPKFYIHEGHAAQLLDLMEMNARNVTIVNIDAHSDLIEYNYEDVKNKSVEEVARDPDMQGSWMSYAIDCGMVKEVIWVVPDPLFEDYGLEGLTVGMRNPRQKDKNIYAVYDDTKIMITTLDNLPQVNKPVVLSVDEDYLGEWGMDWYEKGTYWDVGDSWIDPVYLAKTLKKKIMFPSMVSVFKSSAYKHYKLKDESLILEKELKEVYK